MQHITSSFSEPNMDHSEQLNSLGARVEGELMVELPASLRRISASGVCSIGAFTYFNYSCAINDCNIGRYCSIGAEVLIGPAMHPTGMVSTHPIACDSSGISAGMEKMPIWHRFCATTTKLNPAPSKPLKVSIGNDVWIGSRALIMPGVHIGTGAIIGAGAIVTHDVAPYSIVAGNPARHLRFRMPKAFIAPLLASEWWDYQLSDLGAERDYSEPLNFLQKLNACKMNGMKRYEAPLVVYRDGKFVAHENGPNRQANGV